MRGFPLTHLVPGSMKVAAAACLIGFAAPLASAGFVDSFEQYPGASGAGVAGYAGDDGSGTWSAPTNGGDATVITGDSTAYDGDSLLRIDGPAAGGQIHTIKAFNAPGDLSQGVTFTWAVRRIESPEVAPAGSNAGLITELRFSDGSATQSKQLLNDNYTGQALNTWYIHELQLTAVGTSLQVVYSAVNATDANDVFLSGSWSTGLDSAAHTDFTSIRFFTWSTNHYAHEIDAVTLVPEPASMAMLGLGALALLARRRRKT